MSDTNNFQSFKDVIANIRKVMSSSDTADIITEQQDVNNEILNLEDPENVVELNNIQCARNALSEINQTFQAMADFSATVPISQVSQIKIKPDIEVAITREKIYPDQSNINQFISIEQSSQERWLTTKHTVSEGLSKIDSTTSSEIKEKIHNKDSLLSPESVFASSEEIKKLITQIHHYAAPPNTTQDKSSTIEELVTSILKPELSAWLNNNLHKIVQDVVEQEIKHIVKKLNQG